MDKKEQIFWEHYLTQPIKRNKESYSYILYNGLNENKLDLENIDGDQADHLATTIQYLSTPGEDGYHLFGTMPTELSLFKKASRRIVRKSLFKALRGIAFYIMWLVLQLVNSGMDGFGIYPNDIQLLLIAFILTPLLKALISIIQIKRIRPEDILKRFRYLRFKSWLGEGKFAPNLYLPFVIGIFFSWQYGSWDNPIELFGLVKPLDEPSSYYRLFTVMLVHANFLHLVLSLVVLYYLSDLFLRFASYKRLLLVFFTAIIVSSLFSVVLVPSGTSVGASGGTIGLLGFVLATSIKSRAFIPQKFTIRLLAYAGIAAALSLSTWDAIDNAAHLGGMVAGVICGFLYSEKTLLKKLGKDYQRQLKKNESHMKSLTEKFDDMASKEAEISEDGSAALR